MCGSSQPHYNLGGLMSSLSNFPTLKGRYNLYDLFGNFYDCEIYRIHEYPVGKNVVYAFATFQKQLGGDLCTLHYIGETETSPNRFYKHEKKQKAVSLGASALLIHRLNASQGLSRFDIEKRLITAYQPILNDQHNPRYHKLGTGLFGIGN